MPSLTIDQIKETLKKVKYPGFSRDIVSFGMVKDIIFTDSSVKIKVELTSKNTDIPKQIEKSIRQHLEALPEIKKVEIDLDSIDPEKAKKKKEVPPPKMLNYLPKIKNKIAVASGKGGVGKSTVALNIALALADSGAKVGLYDVDIFGPSLPIMAGINEAPFFDGNQVHPIEKFGIQMMPIGFLVDKNEALVWRGPMVMRAVEQLFADVAWNEELDFLIFDMPPGTGDAQLSLSQLTKLNGSLIVTTPQPVALADAKKGVSMFRKVEIPIFGIVENMSYFLCPDNNKKYYIFGEGGGRQIAREMNVEFLGEIPLQPVIRESGDSGNPIVIANRDSIEAKAFFDISKKLLNRADS